MHRGGVQPRRRLRAGIVPEALVQIEEDLLGDIFGGCRFPEHARGDGGHPGVLSHEESLEAGRGDRGGRARRPDAHERHSANGGGTGIDHIRKAPPGPTL